jgi:hypothetical protein
MIEHIAGNRRLASIGLIAVLAAGCASSLPASATPFVAVRPSSAPIAASALPTPATATSTPTPSSSVVASSAPLPNGDYVSGVVTHATAAAMLKDPKIAKAPVVIGFVAEFSTSAVFTLRLANPRWKLLELEDGQDKGVGDEGTFAFVNDHTIVLQDSSCVFTYGFMLQGASLKMTALKTSCGAPDLAVVRVIFGSTTLTRTP